MVGVLMLISIFVVAAGVLAVMYFSTTPPDKIPAVNVVATNQSRTISLYHAGGDALLGNRLQILVDGTAEPFTGLGSDNTWTLGETLSYTVSASAPMPSRVDVIYNQTAAVGTGSYLIASLLLGTPTSVQQDVTLYTITTTAGTGGSISPSGTVQVASGAPATFAILPNSGYTILGVTVDGSSVGAVTSYTFQNVTATHTIAATFTAVAVNTYWINVTAGPGGTLSPGNQTVSFGANQTYTITPNSGYLPGSVVVNGTPVIPVPSSYTFTNVTTNQTLAATFTSNMTPGCIANYFSDMAWTVPVSTNIAPRIHFADPTSLPTYNSDVSPWPGLYTNGQQTQMSANFTGFILINTTDAYTFYLTSDDGSWLYIDGNLVINNGNEHSAQMVSNTPLQLTPGYHTFFVKFFQDPGQAVVYLNYSSPNITQTENIPFYHTPITVPTAGFTGSPLSGNAPLTVQFNDTSLDATTWIWNFGDGSPASYVQNPAHTYTSIGTYNVTLTAANSFGSSTVTYTNYITVGSYIPGFLATYYYGQTWTTPAGMRTDPEIRYSDNASQPGQPSDEANWAIPMTGGTTNFSVTWDGYLLIAAKDSYTFDLSSDDGSYMWVDGTELINNGGLHAVTTVTGTETLTPGYHHIVVNMYQNQGYAVARLQYTNTTITTLTQVTNVWHVAVVYPPVAGFSATPLTGNAPLPVSFTDSSTNTPTSWSWNFGDGDTTNSTVQNPLHRYTAAGTYSVTLTATNAGGSGSVTQTNYVTISPPLPVLANFTATPVTGVRPMAVTFTDRSTGPVSSWSWAFGDGNTSAAQNPVYTYPNAGLYSVSLTVGNGTVTNSTLIRSSYINVTPPAPVITSIYPSTGPSAGGTIVNITGTNFTGATGVLFGSTAASSYTVNNATSITATAPAVSAGVVDVTVSTAGGTSATSSADQFTYVAPPAVSSISPTTGTSAGGTSVTISGTGFTGATRVMFGSTAASSYTVNNVTSITATSPVGSAGIVDITVTTTGGTSAIVTTDKYDYYTIQSFTAVGTTTWTVPAGVTKVDYLVISGGGGGGDYGGGGGAGGFLNSIGYSVTSGNGLTVTVGAGGNGATTITAHGANGGNSVFAAFIATGGGGGGTSNTTTSVSTGANGGSGGGGVRSGTNYGTGTAGQGNNGGSGNTNGANYLGGGGGGAGGAGTTASTTVAGNGGAGTASSISGASVTYAGGGGGGCQNSLSVGTVSGGGGAGGDGAAGTAGTANTGGGGGGGGYKGSTSYSGGAGGSGIVIIKYY